MTATVIASSAADLYRLMPVALLARSALMNSTCENADMALRGAAGIKVTSAPGAEQISFIPDTSVGSLDVMHGPLRMTVAANDLAATDMVMTPNEGRSLAQVCKDALASVIEAVAPKAGMALRRDPGFRDKP